MRQSGNAIFIVLIGIVLFAALSYAVSKSGRSTGTINLEEARMKASEMVEWGTKVKNALQKVRMVNKCDIANLDYDPVFGDPASNGGRCNVFDPSNSMSAPYQFIADGDPEYYGSYTNPPWPGKVFSVYNSMHVAGVGPAQNDGAYYPTDIIMFIFNIDPEICKAINRIAKVTTTDGEPPLEDSPYEGWYQNPKDDTQFQSLLGIGIYSGTENELKGHSIGCYRAARAGSDMGYHYYHVIEVH